MTSKKVTTEVKKPIEKKDAQFEKEQIVQSKHFKLSEKSFLEVLLKDDEKYSLKEARKLLDAQLIRKVEK